MARRAFFRRFTAALLLILTLAAALPSLAAPRYPAKTDLAVSDNANILPEETVSDLNTFHETLKNKTGVRLWVVTVHFLDGMNVSDFGREVFRQWNLGDEDLLLLISSGDEESITIAGPALEKRFPLESQSHLISAYFMKDFQAEAYSAAFRQYIPQLASSLGKQYGVSVSAANLFGIPAAAPTPVPTVAPSNDSDSWMDYLPGGSKFFAEWEKNDKQTEKPSHPFREEKSSGFSLGSLFILFLLFFLIFGSRKRRIGDRTGCMGCGCGPLGWIVAGLGLGELFKNRNRW